MKKLLILTAAAAMMLAGCGKAAEGTSESSNERSGLTVEMPGQQAGGSYAYDPFEGLPVVFNNTIKAYGAASTGDTYMIVGDLDQGALANFPNGNDIEFKFDNRSLKKQDLVEVLGRQFVALGVVAPGAFVKVTK